MKEIVTAELFNAYKGGVVRTIKAQYNNTSYANLVRADSFGATAVMMKKLKIKEATTKGYAEIGVGGVFQMGFPDSKTRRGRVIDEGNTSPTLDTSCDIGVVEDTVVGGGEKATVSACLTPDREKKRQNGRRFKDDGEPMFTLTAQDRHGVKIDNVEEIRIRKLTPKECFRLQGFPDEYFERAAAVCSDSQLYKQAGNSVTVNVIYEIAKRLKEIEDE